MTAGAVLVVVWLGLGSGVTLSGPFYSPLVCEAARGGVLEDAGHTRATPFPLALNRLRARSA